MMNIAYFSPIPFDFLMQRPQYLAMELSKQHNVTFIEPTISSLRFALKGGDSPLSKRRQISENLNIVRLNGLLTLPRTLNTFDFGLSLLWELAQLRKMLHLTDVAWVGYPGWWPLVSRLGCNRLVYDRMDDCSLMVRNAALSKQLSKNDKALMQRANCVFASAGNLYDEALTINKQSYLLPNAVTADFAQKVFDFIPTAEKICFEGARLASPAVYEACTTGMASQAPTENVSAHEYGLVGKKVFGYVGMIDSWFDFDAVAAIAEADSSHEILLVGPSNIPKQQHNQIKYLGRVPKAELPALISGFDVCLYPFKQNKLLETINPVKIYEYLALNKPVLAVDSRETRTFGDMVNRYDSLVQLAMLSKQYLTPPFDTDEARYEFVAGNNWSKRGDVILAVLDDIFVKSGEIDG